VFWTSHTFDAGERGWAEHRRTIGDVLFSGVPFLALEQKRSSSCLFSSFRYLLRDDKYQHPLCFHLNPIHNSFIPPFCIPSTTRYQHIKNTLFFQGYKTPELYTTHIKMEPPQSESVCPTCNRRPDDLPCVCQSDGGSKQIIASSRDARTPTKVKYQNLL